jgi:1-acyl-sn-glycerol-3-phosphate acyltransferase
LRTDRSQFYRGAQVIAQILTRLLFDLRVLGSENIPRHGGVLIVSNHQSYLDPVVLGAFLDRPLNFVGKSELFSHPLGAWFIRNLNALPLRLDRVDVGAIKETIHRLQQGQMLNLYPEGARSPDGQVHSFKKGAALIIRRAKVPVIPAVIVGGYEAWSMHRSIWQTWPIRVKFGPPMNLDHMESHDLITAAIEAEVRRIFDEMR